MVKRGELHCSQPPSEPKGPPPRLVLLGAPGVGKGTQAEFICSSLGACHLATGDIFRDAKSQSPTERSPALMAALDFMSKGELVPDSTVLALIAERLRCLQCRGGFFLDGFPRTVAQAEALEKLLQSQNVKLDGVLSYDLPIEKIVKRLSGRRVCKGCKAVYHVTTRPPKTAGLCDHCGGELFQREDDRAEAVVRMKAYELNTVPPGQILSRSRSFDFDLGRRHPEEIFKRTLDALDDRVG